MYDYLLLILIVVAIAIGWWLGRYDRKKSQRITKASSRVSKDSQKNQRQNFYITGVNYLLNEQPDQAIDTFIDLMDVNSDTVETHLALGNLLRKRGEIDRAIRVHQNLLACSTLPNQHLLYVRLDLARDYMTAGLFDRAERLLTELVHEDSDIRWASLSLLVDIYQQEKDWLKAIETAEQLVVRGGTKIRRALAHFYCELAHDALQKGHYGLARKNLSHAFKQDRYCVRVSLLQSELEIQLGNYKDAVRVLKRIRVQDPAFITESLSGLSYSYTMLDNPKAYLQYLNKCLEENPSISIVLELADLKCKVAGEKEAAEFIVTHLHERPSIRGLNQLIELQIALGQEQNNASLFVLKELTNELMKNKPIYQCQQCGFEGNALHWLCPSCKTWGSVKPIQGLEGE